MGAVDAVAVQVQAGRAVTKWFYSLDFNERCRDVDYLLRFIHALKERSPAAFGRIQYIEQPTARDLAASWQQRAGRGVSGRSYAALDFER